MGFVAVLVGLANEVRVDQECCWLEPKEIHRFPPGDRLEGQRRPMPARGPVSVFHSGEKPPLGEHLDDFAVDDEGVNVAVAGGAGGGVDSNQYCCPREKKNCPVPCLDEYADAEVVNLDSMNFAVAAAADGLATRRQR